MRTRFGIPVALASLLLALLLAAPAGAATVSTTADSGPGSLRQLVETVPPGETITVPAGNYTLTSGPIQIEASMTIAGAGAGSTVFRAGNFPLFYALGKDRNVKLSGLAIRDTTISGNSVQGGLIFSSEANLSLEGVTIAGNTIVGEAVGGGGGAVQGGLVLAIGGNVSILGSTMAANTIVANGISGKNGGTIQGGGLLYIPNKSGTLNMVDSAVINNTFLANAGQGPASPGQAGGSVQGGAVLFAGPSDTPLTIRGSTIGGNVIETNRGAGGTPGNVQGGGLLFSGPGGRLIASTLAANEVRNKEGSVYGAGGLILPSMEATFAFIGATVAANGAVNAVPGSLGGNLYTSGKVSFANTVVSGGYGPSASANCWLETEPTSLGFNLDSLDQCGFKAPGDKVNVDPQLGPLQDNGGPTPTMLPAASSPLVDQGASFGLATDQRGVIRPIDLPSIPNAAPPGDGSDIGAVELQPTNAFGWGKLQKNRKKGTARLTVNLPNPNAGVLTLRGKGLKPRTRQLNGSTTRVTFVVATKGKIQKALRKKGKRKVGIRVTYTPTGNAPVTKVRKAKLIRKHQQGSKPAKR